MTKAKHFALFGSGLSVKSLFVQNLLRGEAHPQFTGFKGKKGVLFSSLTLDRFIKEEALHDDNTLSKKQGRSLQTFSSGEQRKTLLDHLLSSKPEFLILDNIFDMIDAESVEVLQKRLATLSNKINIIQIIKRKNNLLPFIENAIRIEKDEIVYTGSINEYNSLFADKNSVELTQALPSPLESYNTAKDPFVCFKNVTVKYGERTIVKNINWEIMAGDFWQLKGPNGSGKTTLLTMITGDNPKAYGQNLTLFGDKRGSGESIWEIKKNIGYVTPAMTTLFRGWNTLEKMVISGLVDSIGLYKKPSSLQKQVAGEWISLIGLEDLKYNRFSTLNEAQQCMVLIARAMIKHPPLLILDEPTHGLDDHQATLLSALINKIANEGQTTIIYVSHRKEPGLKPKQVFELVPGECGSFGREIFA